jgi:tetratricopeptide (TPR) repeat protein
MKALFLMVPCLVLIFTPSAYGNGIEDRSSEAILDEANDIFQRALDQSKSDPDKAKSLYEDALIRFKYLIEKRKITNGKLYYNLGNLHYLRGDLGYAILSYRRAQRHIPTDRRLLTNLKVARSQLKTEIVLDTRGRINGVLRLHEDIPPIYRHLFMQIALFLVGVLALLRRFKKLQGLSRQQCYLIPLVIAVLCMVSLSVESIEQEGRGAVLVAKKVVGRKGPHDHAYQPSFEQALTAGLECMVLERRGPWSLIQLASQKETWVRSSTIELID